MDSRSWQALQPKSGEARWRPAERDATNWTERGSQCSSIPVRPGAAFASAKTPPADCFRHIDPIPPHYGRRRWSRTGRALLNSGRPRGIFQDRQLAGRLGRFAWTQGAQVQRLPPIARPIPGGGKPIRRATRQRDDHL
jgi:hypothetical protein